MNSLWTAQQLKICQHYQVHPVPAPLDLRVGIARNVKTGLQPINGVRCAPVGNTTGWYIWAGEEFSEAPDFFVPLHVAHLVEWCPVVIPFLQLPPGWRFLLADGYQDVWFDPNVKKE